MNHHAVSCLVAVALALVNSTLRADPATDAAWQKVDDAIKSIKSPKERPKTREESIANLKKGLTAFDKAMKEFTATAPDDARRWEAKLFEAESSQVRGIVGLPPGSDRSDTLDEILKAPNADTATKAQASALKILFASDDVEKGKGSAEEWTKLAKAHLENYPDAKLNTSIQGKIDSMRATAELKTKPIELKFTAVDGTEVDLAKMRGKVVLIDFWAVWCGPCVAELPNVIKAYEKLHPKGFEIIGISLDSDKAKLEAFIKEKGMTWPQYFDGKSWKNEISSRYGIRSIPAMWLIDKKGMLVSTNVRGRLEEEVEKRLAE